MLAGAEPIASAARAFTADAGSHGTACLRWQRRQMYRPCIGHIASSCVQRHQLARNLSHMFVPPIGGSRSFLFSFLIEIYVPNSSVGFSPRVASEPVDFIPFNRIIQSF